MNLAVTVRRTELSQQLRDDLPTLDDLPSSHGLPSLDDPSPPEAATLVPTQSLAQVIQAIRNEIREEFLAPHNRAWIVGTSTGKDSTALTQLVVETILSLPENQRQHRPLIVVTNDTLVEGPIMQAHADRQWALLETYLPKLLPGVRLVRTTPAVTDTFWVTLLGRGYRAPTRNFRWCTERLKIRPKAGLFREFPGSIVLLGTRRDESVLRTIGFSRRERDGRLSPRSDGTFTFEPIEHLTTEELWAYLLQNPPPWGGTHRDLITLYRNVDGECPVVMSLDDAPSCGTSSARFGCWTCTVVKKDRSLEMQAARMDDDTLDSLLEFRQRLIDASDDENSRASRRRNGQPGIGPLTLDVRQQLLKELLVLQAKLGRPLITAAEISEIEKIWEEDGRSVSLTEEELRFDQPVVLPAIRAAQGGRDFYLTHVTFADAVRVLKLPPERTSPDERYQRDLSWRRARDISNYIGGTFWYLPTLEAVASVVVGEGLITLTPNSVSLLADGQHRLAGIQLALERDRSLGFNSIGLIIHPYRTLNEARQLFADLNCGKPVPKSVRLFLNRRAESVARVAAERPPFVGLIDVVKTTVTTRSPYLWTLSALAGTHGVDDSTWWSVALFSLPGFADVIAGKISPAVARTRYIWAHGVGLRAIGIVKSQLHDPERLRRVDWTRNAVQWQGNAIVSGRMVAANAESTAAAILAALGKTS